MLKFDYLDSDKTKLTVDGKTSCLELEKGLPATKLFLVLGELGSLKGNAFADYCRLRDQPKDMKGSLIKGKRKMNWKRPN